MCERKNYLSKSQGLVERLNKTLVTMLRSCVEEEQKNWDRLLPKILLGYRTRVQTTTGYSPFRMVYGKKAMLPVDIVFGASKERFSTQSQFVSQQEEFLENAFQKVRSHTKSKQERHKYYHDRKVHPSCQKVKYEVGEWVRVHNPSTKRGQVKKLKRCYQGPYKIIKVITDVVYRVQKVKGKQRMVVHYNRLKDASQEKSAAENTVEDTEATMSQFPSEGANEIGSETQDMSSSDPITPTGIVDTSRGIAIPWDAHVSPGDANMEDSDQSAISKHTLDDSAFENVVGAREILTPAELNQPENGREPSRFDSVIDHSDSISMQAHTNQHITDMARNNSDTTFIDNFETDTLASQRTRARRVTKKPAHFNDLFNVDYESSLYCTYCK